MSEKLPLLIMGTSNSVQRWGYRCVMGEAFAPVQNLAVGASSSILHGLRRSEITIEDGYAIFDHTVNEARFQQLIGLSDEIHDAAKDSFLLLCGERRLKPIILIMPHYWSFGRHSPVRKRYLDYAATHRIPFFDGFSFVERLRALIPRMQDALADASAHSNTQTAQALGRCLATAMRMQRAWAMEQLSGWRLGCSVTPGSITHKTSVDTRSFTALTQGQRIEVPVDGKIIGVALNAGNTTGTLSVSGYRKALASNLYGRPYTLIVLPFAKPLAADGSCLVECLPANAPFDETNDAYTRLAEPVDSRIELAALITMTPSAGVVPFADGPLNLVATLSDAQISASLQPTLGV